MFNLIICAAQPQLVVKYIAKSTFAIYISAQFEIELGHKNDFLRPLYEVNPSKFFISILGSMSLCKCSNQYSKTTPVRWCEFSRQMSSNFLILKPEKDCDSPIFDNRVSATSQTVKAGNH